MPIVTPEFGSKVFVVTKLIRREKAGCAENKVTKRESPVTLKVWDESPLNKECLFLGTRTLKNGRREFDSDHGYYFCPDDHFKAALVSPGPNENPVYVPLEAMTELNGHEP